MKVVEEPVAVATVIRAGPACHLARVHARADGTHRSVRFSAALAAAGARVRAAVVASGYRWPPDHTGLTVAADPPCQEPDPGLDLAAAVAVLAATGQLPTGLHLAGVVFLGRLGPSGGIQAPSHLRGRMACAAAAGMRCVLAPPHTGPTAGQRVRVWQVASLRLLVDRLAGRAALVGEPRLDPVRGLDLAALPGSWAPLRRVLEIAAAGGHHLAITSATSWQVAMLGQALAGLLPDLDQATATQLSRIYPRAGLLPRARPHRPPWQPITRPVAVAELAGTPHRGPGLASLAHGGVMLITAQSATGRGIPDTLCHLLDRHRLSITAGRRTVTYPARVQLLLALNSGHHLSAVDDRLAGAGGQPPRRGHGPLRRLLDRIDIHLLWPPTLVVPPARSGAAPQAPTGAVAARVARARTAARRRWAGPFWAVNSQAAPAAVAGLLPPAATGRLEHPVRVGAISPRGLVAVHRLAVTIADLAGRDTPTAADVAEAYRLRTGQHLP